MTNYQLSCREVNAQPALVTFARYVERTFTGVVGKPQLQAQKPATLAQFMKVTAVFWGPKLVVAIVTVAANSHTLMDGKRMCPKPETITAAVRMVEVFVVEDRYKL